MHPVHFPTVAEPPLSAALLRVRPEDFLVSEDLGFAPAGSGEHVWLRVRKRGLNTDQVAGHLARRTGVSRRDISYSGMKDRHAVAEQWFSIWLPRDNATDWQTGMPAGVEILEATRHSRKLQRGTHRRNRFVIVFRECRGDPDTIDRRLDHIRQSGVPNYFGEQRFGHEGGNIARAEAMFSGREEVRDKHRRGIYLSAARSFLFNRVLARRISDDSWERALPGEALILDGKNSYFIADDIDSTVTERLRLHDVHPSGPLWGEGELPCRGQARALEEAVVAEHRALAEGLAAVGLRQERRSLRLCPAALHHEWPDPVTLRLSFSLPRGAYATAVLREVANYRDVGGVNDRLDGGG